MAKSLTYEKVLEIIKETNRLSSERLEKDLEKSRKEFDEELKQSRKEFDRKLGQITGTLGRFVESMVEPKL